MCGIAGFWSAKASRQADELQMTVGAMTDLLRHRGPDDHGTWVDHEAGIALGHRRLSILDLSSSGHQPMISRSGRFVIIYNGEVYNFEDLKSEIDSGGAGADWRGHSDTEVLVEAIERWGVESALNRVNGMFAFALWDRRERTLTLARDRVGKKPLYYGWVGDALLFASELKGLRRYPQFVEEVNRDAVSLLLRHNYIPSPYSIYKGVYKLTPGSTVTLTAESVKRPERFSPHPVDEDNSGFAPRRYWSAKETLETGDANQLNISEDEALEELERLLSDAVRLRIRADVPVGAFLSGGIDSTSVVSLMQAQSNRPVRTFTVGHHEDDRDEAPVAREISQILGTDHTELYVSPRQVMETLPQLPEISDEPLADVALINMFLVSKLARQDVTVALTGDGGDELFAGYPRYIWTHWYLTDWLKRVDWIPNRVRKTVAVLIKALLPMRMRGNGMGRKLDQLANIFPTRRAERVYTDMQSHWPDANNVVLGVGDVVTVYNDNKRYLDVKEDVQRMVYFDLASRLCDALLAKVDRVSMNVSLEVRCPILDYRLIDFAASIPVSMKIQKGQGKCLLRKLAYKYVPRKLIDKPKKGFNMPIQHWLRGPLREWAEDLLEERRLKAEGYFNPAAIRSVWRRHLKGEAGLQYRLWDVLMFQAWLDTRNNVARFGASANK